MQPASKLKRALRQVSAARRSTINKIHYLKDSSSHCPQETTHGSEVMETEAPALQIHPPIACASGFLSLAVNCTTGHLELLDSQKHSFQAHTTS